MLFPGASLPLHIFEERYKEMIGVCLAEKSGFGVVCAQREGLAVIGCTREIVRVLERYADGRLDILCQGENVSRSKSWITPAAFWKPRWISSRMRACRLARNARRVRGPAFRDAGVVGGEKVAPGI